MRIRKSKASGGQRVCAAGGEEPGEEGPSWGLRGPASSLLPLVPHTPALPRSPDLRPGTGHTNELAMKGQCGRLGPRPLSSRGRYGELRGTSPVTVGRGVWLGTVLFAPPAPRERARPTSVAEASPPGPGPRFLLTPGCKGRLGLGFAPPLEVKDDSHSNCTLETK